MENKDKHIIIKRYGDQETLWISEQYLCEKLGVNSEYLRIRCRPAYKQSVPLSHRHLGLLPVTGKSWRWTRFFGCFYYDYTFIPNRSPKYYQSSLGSRLELVELVKFPPMSGEVLLSARAKLFALMEEYRVKGNEAFYYYMNSLHIDMDRARGLSEAWLWMHIGLEYGRDRRWVLLGLEKASAFYGVLASILKERKLPGFRISNSTSLRNKMKLFDMSWDKERGYLFFVHKGLGNENARKVTEELREVAIYLRGLGYNWSDDRIVNKLWQYCDMLGLSRPCERTLESILTSKASRLLTECGRYGAKSGLRRLTNGYLPIAAPLFVGDCWQMDVTRVNMIAHKRRYSEEEVSKGVDKYLSDYGFLNICVVRDVYSRALIGVSYGYSENHIMYVEALQMAVERTGYLPYELVRDRFPGHNTEQWQSLESQLRVYGVLITETSEATGKAQLERTFGTLQSVFMSETIWYYGEGIKSKRKYAHRSEAFLKQVYKLSKSIGFDYTQACEAMDGVVERYNNTKFSTYSRKIRIDKSPYELLNEGSATDTIKVSDWQRDWLFSLKKTIKIGAAGLLKTEILRMSLHYRIEDYEIIKHYDRVVLCYDYRDLSSVRLFSEGGKYLGVANELSAVQVYGKAKDLDRLYSEYGKNVAFSKRVSAEYEALQARVEENYGEVAHLMPLSAGKVALDRAETAALEAAHVLPAPVVPLESEEEELPEFTEVEMKKRFYNSLGGQG